MRDPFVLASKAILIGAALTLAACQPHGANKPVSDETKPTAEIPDGAVKVTDTLYMVPVSKDADGCQEFSAHSTEGFAPTVVYYQRADGTFTERKSEAACET